uniref:C2H2-type domain-containing protein n=1 Tax=Parascaris univalens TaxID=6257 RepID=A0A915AE11_PARUN
MVNRRKQARPVKRRIADSDESSLQPVVHAFCISPVDPSPLAESNFSQSPSGKTSPLEPTSSSGADLSAQPSPCSRTFPSTSRSSSYLHLPEEDIDKGQYDSISPLKCLERYVKPHEETSTRNAVKPLPSAHSSSCTFQRSTSKNPASAPYVLPNKRGNGSTSKGESNALCELSELVHKVGSVRDSTCSETRTDGNCAQSVFTCLQCSRSYETLDELVLHISTTKHFTRMAAKRVEPMAPWEKATVTTNPRNKHRPHQGRVLECTLCGQTFQGDAEYHLRIQHKLDSFMDWISVIKIADAVPDSEMSTLALNKLETLINGVRK